MDATNDIAAFLSSRRAKVTPEQAGLPTYGKRRVPGLRREEVASLTGVSIDYYKRLERGNVSGISDSVLEALATALQLDDAERSHLLDLARAANPMVARRRRPVQQRVRPVVQRILDSVGTPALVRNARVDYLAANPLGRALYAPLFDSPEQPANSARFTFLDRSRSTSSRTGSASRPTSSPICAPRLHATGMTVVCRTSSGSCRPAATSSAPAGRRTTCASTGPARSGSITPS